MDQDARPWHLTAPTFDDIEQAAGRIAGVLVETPLLESERLNARLGGRLLVKAEGLQRTGSFKARGAWNRLSLLSEHERAAGVVAFSSGNHGQAVAWAGRRLGVGTVVVAMPANAPAAKIKRTRGWGAEVVLFDRATTDRDALAHRLSTERGLVLVPPYDDRAVIAGAGTLGLEAARQAAGLGAEPDALLVCCAGGGLTAGCATAWATVRPGAAVFAVEPAGFDDVARSLRAGERLGNAPGARSLCDALQAPMPGTVTFPILQRHVAGGLVVTDAEVVAAMRTALEEFGLVVEAGGAAALAAALAGHHPVRGRTVLAVLTGANVDVPTYAGLLASAPA